MTDPATSPPPVAKTSTSGPSVWFWVSAISVVLSYFIGFVLLVFIVPVIAEMFADFGAELAKPTQMILGFSSFLKSYFLFMALPLLGLSAISVWVLFELDKRKRTIAVILLGNLPPAVVILMIFALFLPLAQLSSVLMDRQ